MPSVKIDFRTAKPEDIPALREIWRASFGDPNAYLDFFFSRRFVPENTLTACADGHPVSQLLLLPTALRSQDSLLSADYLFAAATHPDYRKQGIMTALLAKARALCAERGKDAIVLLPGTRELVGYYKKNGYETAFFRRRWSVTRDMLVRMAVPAQKSTDIPSDLQRLLLIRDGLCWDAFALEYALAEHRTFRGTYASSAHAFVRVSDSEAEILCAPQHFGEGAALLLDMSDRTEFTLVFPSDIPFGSPEDAGMLCRLCKKPIHLRDAFLSFAME